MEGIIDQMHVIKNINIHKNKLIKKYKKVYRETFYQNLGNKENFQNVDIVEVQHVPNTHAGNWKKMHLTGLKIGNLGRQLIQLRGGLVNPR